MQAINGAVSPNLRGAPATTQSRSPVRRHGLLRCARNDALIHLISLTILSVRLEEHHACNAWKLPLPAHGGHGFDLLSLEQETNDPQERAISVAAIGLQLRWRSRNWGRPWLASSAAGPLYSSR